MVRARKRWGQHWLASSRLANDLVGLIDLDAGDHVIEIGPGTGLMTAALLERGAHVTAIEVDPRCAERLEAELEGDRLEVIRADIRTIEDARLPWQRGPVHLVGNLPYNLSGPILRWTAAHSGRIKAAHFMLQQEVADRIAADAGSRSYGALSVQMQWQFEVDILKRLSPGAFRPPPKVRSAVVHITALPEPRFEADQKVLERVVAKAFNQRRKMLRAALKGLSPDIEDRIKAAGLTPTDRAEQVPVEGFCALAREVAR